MRPYKIAIAGTHSTGKSTFVEALRKALREQGRRVESVHDSAQDARDLGFPILAQHTFESTSWLIANAMRLEAEASLKAEVIIVDRPVPDALGYLAAALRHTGRHVEHARWRRLEDMCEAWIGEYDLIFVTQIDPSIPIGEGRDGDANFRVLAAEEVERIVARLAPDRVLLPSGDTALALALSLARVTAYFEQSIDDRQAE